MRYAAALAVVAAVFLLPQRVSAQVDFTGAWVLDRDVSGDLARATFDPQQESDRSGNSGGFTGGIGGVRVFGGGNRGGGGRGGNREGGSREGSGLALTPDEHARLREIADWVRGLTSMTIEHSDRSTFTVTDAHGRSRLFTTDGKTAPQAFATATVDAAMKWDGPHLVTAFHISDKRDLLLTYILVPATRQMALRITLDDAGRVRADVPELRLVYKMKPAQAATPKPD